MLLKRGWSRFSGSTLAIGFFDGLHLGHRRVLDEAYHRAVSSAPLCVVTFYPHPQHVLSPQEKVKYLTLYGEKYLTLLRLYPGAFLMFLRFGHDLRKTPPLLFLECIAATLHPRVICVGENFRFGFQRQGTPELLRKYFAPQGVDVITVPSYTFEGETISSSRIREYLARGELEKANRLLGSPFSVVGKVRRGRQLGRALGIPTLNLYPPSKKLLPPPGVYVGSISLEKNATVPFPALVYTGTRPTFQDTKRRVVEVFIPHSSFPELYNTRVCVTFEQFVREEMVFSSTDALQAQIQRDIEAFLLLSRDGR